jgi:hypothetical protein
MPSSKPVWERRAWSASFPGLSPPGEAEGWAEEAYLLPLGLGGRNIKISGDALEMKDLVVARPDMQLWHPAARLTFPVPSASLERELMVRLALGQPLTRERYTAGQLLDELVGPRHNVAVVRLKKRRRLFEAAGCRAEVAEVDVGDRRILTACAEHEDPARLRQAAAELGLGLDRYPNLDYPTALARLVVPRRAA